MKLFDSKRFIISPMILMAVLLGFCWVAATIAQITNNHGCLIYDPIQFVGFQQPPALNFAQTFVTPSECTLPGTLYTPKIVISNITTYSCECALGYTGQRCQFRLIDYTPRDPAIGIVGAIGFDNTIPLSYHLHDRLMQFVMETNKSEKYIRFVWGYVDPATPTKYTILEHIPFVKESIMDPIGVTIPYFGLTSEELFGYSPQFHATLSPMDSLFGIKSPTNTDLPFDITCLTLLSYEVNNNDININPITNYSTTSSLKYEPIAQFTVFKKLSDLAEYIPDGDILMPPGDCQAPYEWQLSNMNSPPLGQTVEFHCLCPGGDPNVFGPNCEYQTSEKLNASCPSNIICDPSQSSQEEACLISKCRPGRYTLPIDQSPCGRFFTIPANHPLAFIGKKPLISSQFVVIDLLPHLITTESFNDGEQFPSFTAKLKWNTGESEEIPFTYQTKVAPAGGGYFGFQIPTFSQPTDQVTITLTEHYLDGNGQPQSGIARIFDQISIVMTSQIMINTSKTIHGDAFNLNTYTPPQPQSSCNTQNTLRISFDESKMIGQYRCICQPNWYGPECDVEFILSVATGNPGSLQIIKASFTALQSHVDKWINKGFFPVARLQELDIFPESLAAIPEQETFFVFPPGGIWSLYFSVGHGIDYYSILKPVELLNIPTCDITTSCTPGQTLYCSIDQTLGDTCHCTFGWFGPKCETEFSFPIVALNSAVSMPLFSSTLLPNWNTRFYVGQLILLSLPPELFPAASSVTLSSPPGRLLTGTSPISGISDVMPRGPISIYAEGFPQPLLQLWDQPVTDPCDWLDTWNSEQSIKSCSLSGTESCNLTAQDPLEVCQCRPMQIIQETKMYIFHVGQFCHVRISIPMGPFYQGQLISISTRSEIGISSLPPSPRSISLFWTKRGVSDFFGLGTASLVSSFTEDQYLYATYQVEIDHNGHIDPQPPSLQTRDELDQLDLTAFSWSIEWDVAESGTVRQYVTDPSYETFRIVDPCEWSQLTQHSTICAEEKDENGEYIAVESCMNPETHQIECKCKKGYHFHECRYHFDLKPLPSSIGNDGEMYVGQFVDLEITFLSEPLDKLELYSPPNHTIKLGFLEFPEIQKLNTYPENKAIHRISDTNDLFDQLLSVPDPLDFKPSLPSPIPPMIQISAATNNQKLPRWVSPVGNEVFLRSVLQPDSILKGISQISKLPTDGVQSIYGISCPANIVTAFGCRCGHWGIFGPNCNFKINLKPLSPILNARMGYSLTTLGQIIFEYTVEEILPIVPTPNGRNWSLPKKYHFETYVLDSKPNVMEIIHLEKKSNPPDNNQILFPFLQHPSYTGLYLINDDDDVPQEMQRLQIFEGQITNDFSNLPGVEALFQRDTSLPRAICKDKYTGAQCEWQLGLPLDMKIPLVQHYSPGLDGTNGIPTVALLVIPFQALPNIGTIDFTGAYLIRAPTALQSTQYLKHSLIFDPDLQTLTLEQGQLNNFDQLGIKYNLIFEFTGFNLQYKEPFTISNPPCLLDNLECQTYYSISSPITSILPPALLNPNNHNNSPPIIIVYPNTEITFTIPYYDGVNGDITIKLEQYLPISTTPGQYSTTSVTLLTYLASYSTDFDPDTNPGLTLKFNLPPTLIATKLFYSISFPYFAAVGSPRQITFIIPTCNY